MESGSSRGHTVDHKDLLNEGEEKDGRGFVGFGPFSWFVLLYS